MVIITNASTVSNMIFNGELSIIKKPQRKTSGFNYFLSPIIGFVLYKPKVVKSDLNYMVLEFNRIEHATLFLMLQSLDSQIQAYLKRSYIVESEAFHSIIKCTETTFSIRCHLPHLGKKYYIESKSDGQVVYFVLPRINAEYDCVTVEIRNIWECNNRLGYNVEIKSTSF